MKKIIKLSLVVFLLLAVLENGISQITKTKIQLTFDEVDCKYNVYLHVIEGSAITFGERIPFNPVVSLILPVESQGINVESFIPNTSAWGGSNYVAFPGGDADKTFFNINHSFGTQNIYPEMNEGDIVLLFSFSVDNDAQGVKGLRAYNGSIDDPGAGGAYGTGFSLGGIDSHDGYLPSIFGASFAETIGPSVIQVDGQTTLSPLSGGEWTHLNPTVSSFDETTNIVTGLTEGRDFYSFVPDDGSCPTSVVVVVDELIATSGAGDSETLFEVGEVLNDHSSELSVHSTTKGVLIPRMTEIERLCVVGPAKGLLLYQINNDSGFYYFDGAQWKRLSNSATVGTASYLEGADTADKQLSTLDDLMLRQVDLEQQFDEQEKMLRELSDKVEKKN